MALTAALCLFFIIANLVLGEKTIIELSLLPTAKYSPSGDHFKPQISCLGPLNSNGAESLHLKSCNRSFLSREPVRIRLLKMEIAPTRSSWDDVKSMIFWAIKLIFIKIEKFI